MSERELRLRARPRIERLEDRCTPASFTVITNTDVYNGGAGVGSYSDPGVNLNGFGNLRWCIRQANLAPGEDTIMLPAGRHVVLQKELDHISSTIRILGQGSGQSSIARDVAGPDNFRLFTLEENTGSLVLQDLRLTGGKVPNEDGGGILAVASLTMRDVQIDACSAKNGGGLKVGQFGMVDIQNCAFINNTASERGGGIFIHPGDMGVRENVIKNTLISGNSASDGGGLANSCINYTELLNCTIINNTASERGGGVYNFDGGVLHVTGGRIGSNLADEGGGLYTEGHAWLTELTVSSNLATSIGGGIYGKSGDLAIDGGTVTANGAPAADAMYLSVTLQYLEINDPTVTGSVIVGP
jgi:predicted outer membrane repeat protein